MKKLLFITLSLLFVLVLVGCDKDKPIENVIAPDQTAGTKLEEVVTTAVYANWAEDNGGLFKDEACLNADKLIFSDVPRLPIFKFESKAELVAFKEKYQDVFSMTYGYDEAPSFEKLVAEYDDAFFENHVLLLTYKEASSGSFHYAISDVKKVDDTLVLSVTQTNHPEAFTDDMSGWFLVAEVSKKDLADIKSYDAQYPDGVAKTEYVDNSLLIITNGHDDYEDQNEARMSQFMENVQNGKGDYITIIAYTIEGDPITTTVKFGGTGTPFLVTVDTREDKFGVPGITENEYDSSTYQAVLEELPEELGPGEVAKYRYAVFRLKNGEEQVDIAVFRFHIVGEH